MAPQQSNPTGRPETPRKRVRFYKSAAGRAVVLEEIKGFGEAAEAALLEIMKRIAKNEHFHHELERIDADLSAARLFMGGSTYRLLFSLEGTSDRVILAIHAVQKKEKKLPKAAQQLAHRRLSDWRSRGND